MRLCCDCYREYTERVTEREGAGADAHYCQSCRWAVLIATAAITAATAATGATATAATAAMAAVLLAASACVNLNKYEYFERFKLPFQCGIIYYFAKGVMAAGVA
jgi:hypothetical protein